MLLRNGVTELGVLERLQVMFRAHTGFYGTTRRPACMRERDCGLRSVLSRLEPRAPRLCQFRRSSRSREESDGHRIQVATVPV